MIHVCYVIYNLEFAMFLKLFKSVYFFTVHPKTPPSDPGMLRKREMILGNIY